MWCLTCSDRSCAEGEERCGRENGSDDAGLLVLAGFGEANVVESVVLLWGAMEVRAVRGLADDLDRGVGDAVVLSVSVGRRFGGFLELALSGAMMLPTDRREKWAGSRTWSSMSPV